MNTKQLWDVGRRRLRFFSLVLLVGGLATACFGEVEPESPKVGSESHFLRLCEETCADGLDCLSGVCTAPCVVGDSESCTEFPSAICTNGSGEPGEVAVCDVSCSGDRDCSVLTKDHACSDGFCRAPLWKTPTEYSGHESLERFWNIPVGDNVRCLNLDVPYLDDGTLDCAVVEVAGVMMGTDDPDCQREGHRPIAGTLEDAVRADYLSWCEAAEDCQPFDLCEVEQLEAAGRNDCLHNAVDAGALEASGFCAINETLQDAEGTYIAGGSPEGSDFVGYCPEEYTQVIRFTGSLPLNSVYYLACGLSQ